MIFEINVPRSPVDVFIEQGADTDHGEEDAEKKEQRSLRRACETNLLFRFCYGFVIKFQVLSFKF